MGTCPLPEPLAQCTPSRWGGAQVPESLWELTPGTVLRLPRMSGVSAAAQRSVRSALASTCFLPVSLQTTVLPASRGSSPALAFSPGKSLRFSPRGLGSRHPFFPSLDEDRIPPRPHRGGPGGPSGGQSGGGGGRGARSRRAVQPVWGGEGGRDDGGRGRAPPSYTACP